MMPKKMSWEEMKRQFPNEWLMVVNFKLDKYGEVEEGEVIQHSTRREEIVVPHPHPFKEIAFSYTGESTFEGGFRFHADHHCF
jgi:hypothetical protein